MSAPRPRCARPPPEGSQGNLGTARRFLGPIRDRGCAAWCQFFTGPGGHAKCASHVYSGDSQSLTEKYNWLGVVISTARSLARRLTPARSNRLSCVRMATRPFTYTAVALTSLFLASSATPSPFRLAISVFSIVTDEFTSVSWLSCAFEMRTRWQLSISKLPRLPV